MKMENGFNSASFKSGNLQVGKQIIGLYMTKKF